jgi:putative transposase
MDRHKLSARRSCRLAGLAEASWYYRPQPNRRNEQISARLRELAGQRPAFGAPRMTVMIQREFGRVNHKRVERLYALQGLQLPRRIKRRRRGQQRVAPAALPTAPGQRGSMDFVHDVLADGRRYRVLVVVDDYSRECLALEVDTSITGQRVTRVLNELRAAGCLPQVLVCDNGTEFTSRAMLTWSHATATKLHFIQPGKPTQNAYCESFNGKLRIECLRQHWFRSLHEARQMIEDWRQDYNHVRPHSALGQMAPAEALLTEKFTRKSHSEYSGWRG